jgi:hypothetical protein
VWLKLNEKGIRMTNIIENQQSITVNAVLATTSQVFSQSALTQALVTSESTSSNVGAEVYFQIED